MFSNKIPSSGNLVYALRCYSARNFSYPEDAFTAFVGIANALSDSFIGGFISGLPAAFFHVALLWRHREYCKRREPRKTSNQVCLPSWSWLGWQCDLHPHMWEAAADYCVVPNGTIAKFRVQPLVQWYYHRTVGDDRTAIRCHWDESRDRYYFKYQCTSTSRMDEA
jgi:hypothetical protein